MKMEEEIARLLTEANGLFRCARFDAALQAFERAEPLVRELFAADPSAHAYGLGSLLYAKAGCLNSLDRPGDSLAALDEAERCYEQTHGKQSRVDLLVADVWVRRAVAQARRGFSVSAACEFERAIPAFIAGSPAGAAPALDIARVLASGAVHSGMCVDPDVAATRADHATMRYLAPAVTYAELGSSGNLPVMALALASEIHAANGRLELALQADSLAVHLARRFKAMGAPWAAALLARQLAVSAVHQRANGQPESAAEQLAEAQRLDPLAVERAAQNWAAVERGVAREQNTLARALARVRRQLGPERVPAELDKALIRGPVITIGSPAPPITSVHRCGPEAASVLASELGALAIELTTSDGAAALRLGLEAHMLLLGASRAQTWAMRYSFSEFGVPWTRLLLHFSRFLQAQREHALAMDLAEWACAVSERLVPFRSLLEPQLFDELVKGSAINRAELLACRWRRDEGA
jgi:tetratricopeptide (TPR) repeat protein